MNSRVFWDLIGFGTNFRYLQDAAPRYKIHGKGFVLDVIDGLFRNLDVYRFPVTLRAASQLRSLRDELAATEPTARLTPAQATSLAATLKNLRPTFRAEALGKVVFITTEKRLDTEKLSSNVAALFRAGTFLALSPTSQHDIAEAGKCILFERSTAAAFHLMRATEDTLRAFYLRVIRRNRIKPPLLWGPMVAHLRKLRNPSPRPLLDNLDNIRMSFRNPTQHPDKVYDIDEAQDLFSLCVDVINRMQAYDP